MHPDIQAGMDWGEPRYGHPEGKVLYHVKDVLDNIDRLDYPLSINDYQSLRLIALLHDSFKYQESKTEPRDWSQHHGILARGFASAFIEDTLILNIIESHDEAYYCWRLHALYNDTPTSDTRFKDLLQSIDGGLQLYYLFFKCDTATGDKTQAPIKWFEHKGLPIIKTRLSVKTM